MASQIAGFDDQDGTGIIGPAGLAQLYLTLSYCDGSFEPFFEQCHIISLFLWSN